jgi:hypothetical protein
MRLENALFSLSAYYNPKSITGFTLGLKLKRASGVYHSNRGLPRRKPPASATGAHGSISHSSHPHRSRLLPILFSLSKMSSANLQSIRDALDTYAEQMKIDLKDNPFAEEVKGCESPEAILKLLEKNRDEFKEYRDKNRKFIDCLNPVVKFVHTFSEVLGEATSLVSAERLRSSRSPYF